MELVLRIVCELKRLILKRLIFHSFFLFLFCNEIKLDNIYVVYKFLCLFQVLRVGCANSIVVVVIK